MFFGGTIMPAIYTFSLDYSRDRDIIALLESKKNRSDYLRTILRKQMLEQLYIDAFHDVYSTYSSTIRVHAGRDPLPKSEFIARNISKNTEEE
jgi:hypothetical protein